VAHDVPVIVVLGGLDEVEMDSFQCTLSSTRIRPFRSYGLGLNFYS
jgi:hypothetical protein